MQFAFLGPLTIKSGSSTLSCSGPRNRSLIAALLLDANRTVSIDRLIDVAWDHPPETARQQVQNRIGRLRALLGRTPGQGIRSTGGGYLLEVREEQVDGLRFRRLCAEAEQARRLGELDRAAERLHSGLDLWQGSAFQDIDSLTLRGDAIGWEEARLNAVESLVDVEFSRHRHNSIMIDLHHWVQRYPYHEGLHCRLAEALHARSRTGEALHVLQQLSARLTRELGIDACAAVQSLQRHLGRKPDLDEPAQVPGAVRRASPGTMRVRRSSLPAVPTA
ncbi:AfsR/SARP family transcriptional regulator [Micromonospora harpali]|uniref:AfsR/SARP family transcriptional regulator n=1 Tax=Micromonospora harpali TaxID=1490225 RepID=A0ABW1HRQ8_9ACTN